MGTKEDLFLWFMNFFDKKSKESGVNIPLEFNKLLSKELPKPIIRKFKKKKSLFRI